jgi:hypothetical protein
MRQLGQELDLYRNYKKKYPIVLKEVSTWYKTLTEDEKQREKKLGTSLGCSLDFPKKDGWDNEFVYTSDGFQWKLLSYGADGKLGGIGINADVFCTNEHYRWRRAILMQKCFLSATPTCTQTIIAEWLFLLKLSGLIFITTVPVFLYFYLIRKRQTIKKYGKEVFIEIICLTLLYFLLRQLAVILFYILPGD